MSVEFILEKEFDMLKKIILNNFRNFGKREFEFGSKINVIVGPNASGKTNILEGIFFLATGKSFKARLEREVIKYREEVCRIVGSHFAEASRGKWER